MPRSSTWFLPFKFPDHFASCLCMLHVLPTSSSLNCSPQQYLALITGLTKKVIHRYFPFPKLYSQPHVVRAILVMLEGITIYIINKWIRWECVEMGQAALRTSGSSK
jgi:hypothetical protein